jgi:hypothetical protein
MSEPYSKVDLLPIQVALVSFPQNTFVAISRKLHTKSFAESLPWRVVTELSKLKAKLAVAKGGETAPREKTDSRKQRKV